jgi:dihydropteroate synthase
VSVGGPPLLRLRLRAATLAIRPGGPLLMGVVNASPESFSDGSEMATLERRMARAGELLEQGADLVDVGGESGVTNRAPLDPDAETARILPLVTELVGAGAMVSVDTWKAPVALAALEAGAHLINDVSGLADPEIARHCARFGAGLVVMHTRSRPKVKDFPAYDDVAGDVRRFLEQRTAEAVARGVDPESVVLDPGPDFAKTPAQTVEVLRRLGELTDLGRPLLLAVSRKDFVGALTGRAPRDRLAGTLAAVGEGVDAGASILRVHDVAAVRDYLAVRAALRGAAPVDPSLHLPEHLRREAPAADGRR